MMTGGRGVAVVDFRMKKDVTFSDVDAYVNVESGGYVTQGIYSSAWDQIDKA